MRRRKWWRTWAGTGRVCWCRGRIRRGCGRIIRGRRMIEVARNTRETCGRAACRGRETVTQQCTDRMSVPPDEGFDVEAAAGDAWPAASAVRSLFWFEDEYASAAAGGLE